LNSKNVIMLDINSKNKDIFQNIECKSFSYYNNYNSQKILVNIIGKIIALNGSLEIILEVLKNEDFRLLGNYYNILANKDFILIKLLSDMCNKNISRALFYKRMFIENNKEIIDSKINFKVVDEFEKIFDDSSKEDVLVYTTDAKYQQIFSQLFIDLNGNVGAFIDKQFDLSGVNSLVRRGLVKKIIFDNNNILIAKRNNPDKPGRFIKEHINIARIVKKMDLKDENSFLQLSNSNSLMKVVRPRIVFSDINSKAFYALSNFVEGDTLEEIFLKEENSAVRLKYFTDVRAILEKLYSYGVIWWDMAPRNIIVKEIEGQREYYLLDFEKTEILDYVPTIKERIEHCRGSMCIEEFGAVCFRNEVEKCFSGYFNSDNWDLESNECISLNLHKKDYIEILKRRGIESPTISDYNKLEIEIMTIRFPYYTNSNELVHPLYTGFKIDHYLGFECDLMLTLILIESKKQKCYHEIIIQIMHAIETYENKIIELELETENIESLDEIIKNCSELKDMQHLIDNLYHNLTDLSSYI